MNKYIPSKEDLEERKRLIEMSAKFMERTPLRQGSNQRLDEVSVDDGSNTMGANAIRSVANTGKKYWNRFMNDFGKPATPSDPTHPANRNKNPSSGETKSFANSVDFKRDTDGAKLGVVNVPAANKIVTAPGYKPDTNGVAAIDKAMSKSDTKPIKQATAKPVQHKPVKSSSGHSAVAATPRPVGDVAQTTGVTATMSKSADGSKNFVNRGSGPSKGVPTPASIAAQRAKSVAKSAVKPSTVNLDNTRKHSDSAAAAMTSASAKLDQLGKMMQRRKGKGVSFT